MGYTKPNTYNTGTKVDFSQQNANDDEARFAINQGIEASDIADDAFDFDSIQRGELNPIVNSHEFTTGNVHGQSNSNRQLERSYFTSQSKANSQTGVSSVQYQTVFETGDRIVMEYPGIIFINFGGTFISNENISNGAPPFNGGSHPGQGKWDSRVLLKLYDESNNSTSFITGTRAFSFEETSAASAGALNPGGGGVIARRWIGFQWSLEDLPAGAYQLSLVINPKVESGFAGPRSFTIESFYT